MEEFAPPTGSWPLLLCGPMLRRVSLSSVTVFLAFSAPRQVTLHIFERGADGLPAASIGQSPPQSTIRLGERLHVLAATATGLSLHPSTLYCYDVSVVKTIDSKDTGAASVSLATILENSDLLSGPVPLGYSIGRLPSFVTPPLEAAKLHFYHGSCRKMHGGGGDALLALDDELDSHIGQSDRRAQMLFLTGDQIYADDVAGPLLPVLTELASKLLGWNEKVPDAGGPTLLAGLLPGSRGRYILRGDLSSDHGHCHLLGLGEFYAMYLLAWSPALWPAAFPTPAKVLPATALTPADPQGGTDTAEVAAIREYLAKFNWQEQVARLTEFRQGLERVRRTLANIPSYMMFDDHEVTDDWYLNAKWQTDVLSAPEGVGRRVIGNALAGYAVFQGWGNDAESSFAPTTIGRTVLTHLEAIGRLQSDTYRAGQSDHDGLRIALRAVPQSNATGMLWDYAFTPDARCDWKALVLDTRTHRNLTAPGQTDLIEVSDMARQFRARTANPAAGLTLVVSPAPVFGHPFVEEAVGGVIEAIPENLLWWRGIRERARRSADNETWLNARAPAAFEQLLLELSRLGRVLILSGDVHYGFSAAVSYWNRRQGAQVRSTMLQLCSSALRNEDTLTHLVGSLGSREFRPQVARILNETAPAVRKRLSEGFTTVGRLYVIAPLSGQKTLMLAGQALIATAGTLVEAGVVLGPDALAKIAPALAPPGQTDYLGWESVVPRVPAGSRLRQPETRPAIIKVQDSTAADGLPPPEWSYRLRFCSDLDPDETLPDPAQFGLESGPQRRQRLKDELQTCGPSSQYRLVVGQSNIGRVRIFGESGHLRIRHDLERIDGNRRPVTRHFLPLAAPDPTEPEPGRSAFEPTPDLSIWMDLLSYKPDPALGLRPPGVEAGVGLVRLDCYGVKITSAPTRLPGEASSRAITLAEFMEVLRRQMLLPGVLLDAALGSFSCVPASDSARWAGTLTEATGCALVQHVHDETSLSGSPLDWPLPVRASEVLDSGFVLTATDSHSSIGLAGNRGVFGMPTSASADQWLIFTLGAHRSAGPVELPDPAWNRLHRMWSSFPSSLAALVVAHGGQATPTRSAQHKVSWSRAAMGWFSPRHPQ